MIKVHPAGRTGVRHNNLHGWLQPFKLDLAQLEDRVIYSQIYTILGVLNLRKLDPNVVRHDPNRLLILGFDLKLNCQSVKMGRDLRSAVGFRQSDIILFYNCHIRYVYRVGIPGVSIINDELLGEPLHQRVRYVLFLNGALDISELREKKRRLHVGHLGLMGLHFFDKISGYISS